MKTKIRIVTASLALAGLLALSGCAAPEPSGLSDDQVVAVTENLLAAIDAGDFAAFSRDFSPDMLAAFGEAEFGQMGELLAGASGAFVSAGAPELSNSNGYAIYRLRCVYEKEDVVVTLSLKVGGDQIEGLWFDSPNLRSASQ